jgi:hypothetical protein
VVREILWSGRYWVREILSGRSSGFKQEVVVQRAVCGSTVNGVAFRVLDPIVFARPCDSILGIGTSIDQTVGPLDKHITAIGMTKHAPDLGVRVIGVHASLLRQVDETVVAGGW